MVHQIEDEDTRVQDGGLLIMCVGKRGWQRATPSCNDVYQVENKIKFIAAEALRGVSSLIFIARENRLANELGRRDFGTVET